MQRRISIIALLFSSVSAILGSGWLFAAYYTSKLAGPASLVSWLIGSTMMIVVAFVFAELASMLPIVGSSTRIPHFTHGTLTSFVFAWVIWLGYAALSPTEVQAVLQYMSYFFPTLVHDATGGLTPLGYLGAAVLMLLVSIMNIYSLRWLFRCNNILTVLKLCIPIIVGAIILSQFFSWHGVVHSAGSTFNPLGWHGIFAAISTGGIVFAFNGFKQACELAGEAKRPHIALPVAVIGSILMCLLIYLLLQFSLLSSLSPNNIINGWARLDLSGANSPLASIVIKDHLATLLPLLYIGAIIAPVAAALMYASSAARSLYGMSKNKHIPQLFSFLSKESTPSIAIITNFVLGMLMFLPLPGWNAMVSFLASLMAVTYAVGPICLIALRHQMPKHNRPFQLPFATLWATVSFYFCTLLIYWCGWVIIYKLAFCLVIGFIVLFIHRFFITTQEKTPLNWKASIWLWFYFPSITIISYLGNFGGGLNKIGTSWDFILLAIVCIITIWLAMKFKLPSKETREHIQQIEESIPAHNS